MKMLFRLILIMVLAFSSLKAHSAVMKNYEIKKIIAQQVLNTYKNYTDAELSVEVVTLPFKDLELPNGNISFKIESYGNNKFMPRTLEKVTVYANDKFIKTFNAPIVVKAWENVLVASSPIKIGQQITPNVVVVKKTEISNILEYPLRATALKKDMMAKKFFREGEIIDKRFVKLKPEVVRNAKVTVLFNVNNLTITTEAIALSDGTLGDSICLMNKYYNKIYTGKVISENKVLVQI
ncbi:MAG: flagellar basal body P-ring formation chaperone FlgA [Candidatus Gastranaerophilales bacterium]|nr:flagellar basal body P-ring formation chaperone FlgA [Candidatus Gastranaerophilales bacterium]